MLSQADYLRSTYELFNAGDLDGLVARFARGAAYNQVDTSWEWNGRDQVRGAFVAWQRCFPGARVAMGSIKEAAELVSLEVGATRCLHVGFTLTGGTYAQTFPGLEGDAPANGKQISLPVGHTIWFNDPGEIVRVDSAFSIAALR